jgi:hypothetical protein
MGSFASYMKSKMLSNFVSNVHTDYTVQFLSFTPTDADVLVMHIMSMNSHYLDVPSCAAFGTSSPPSSPAFIGLVELFELSIAGWGLSCAAD